MKPRINMPPDPVPEVPESVPLSSVPMKTHVLPKAACSFVCFVNLHPLYPSKYFSSRILFKTLAIDEANSAVTKMFMSLYLCEARHPTEPFPRRGSTPVPYTMRCTVAAPPQRIFGVPSPTPLWRDG